jgi:hypothetical protein
VDQEATEEEEPDAAVDAGEGRLLRGKDAVRAHFLRGVAEGRKFQFGEQRPAVINGDLALTSTRLPDGTVTAGRRLDLQEQYPILNVPRTVACGRDVGHCGSDLRFAEFPGRSPTMFLCSYKTIFRQAMRWTHSSAT